MVRSPLRIPISNHQLLRHLDFQSQLLLLLPFLMSFFGSFFPTSVTPPLLTNEEQYDICLGEWKPNRFLVSNLSASCKTLWPFVLPLLYYCGSVLAYTNRLAPVFRLLLPLVAGRDESLVGGNSDPTHGWTRYEHASDRSFNAPFKDHWLGTDVSQGDSTAIVFI